MKSQKLLIAACVSLISACAAGISQPDGNGGSGNQGTTGEGASTGTGATTGTGGSTTGTGTGGSPVSVTLPLAVSSVFVPSGYMGDGSTAGAVAMMPLKTTDPQDCGGDRSPAAIGTCYTVTYTPVSGGQGWAGVYWQYPANNWGAQGGLGIPAGATEVSIWAKGAAGGESLTLVAGGIETTGMAHEDTFKANSTATLTTSWAQYTITLPSTYGPVLGGFAWSVAAPKSGGSVQFSVDSIQWK